MSFLPTFELVVSYGGEYLTVGPTSGFKKGGSHVLKASSGVLNKWICLSVHWDVDGGQSQSFLYCNREKLATFTSFFSDGSTQMTFGDLNPSGIAPLKGDIALFLLYRHRMTESDNYFTTSASVAIGIR